jgi:hypothetical protein
MDTSVLQTVGQVAGIGGLALGVLLLIFREVIRKNIFPNLAQIQAFRIIRLLIVATFLIAALGVAAWAYVQTVKPNGPTAVVFPTDSPEPVITQQLDLMDAGEYRKAWDLMSDEAKRRFQYEFVVKAFDSQRKPLGNVVDRRLQGIQMYQQLPDSTRGAFATATYISKFQDASILYGEAVTAIAESGKWKVLFHQLAPCQPGQCPEPVSPGVNPK